MESDVPPEVQESQPDRPGVASNAKRRFPSTALVGAVGISVVVLALFAAAVTRQHGQQNQVLRASGVPSSVSSSIAALMGLSPVPARSAPTFTLTDQRGNTLSLADFKGRAVVLEFMDPHCTDICPIVSQEFINASRDLGADASRVVFAAVNVNTNHLSVADVNTFSQERQLNSIPAWHFFTGPASDLESVWNHYGIVVQAPSPSADIVHSSFVFFIGPDGREHYLANPTDDRTASGAAYLPTDQLTSWGQGIALTARSLLSSPR
jgi:cytochrome oxidase Cu insertion factor (SCO1/SenC/PrrC family)